MNNVVSITSKASEQEAILEQASLWLAKLDRGIKIEEKQQFQQWLFRDPKHLEVTLETAAMLDKLNALDRLADIVPEPTQDKKSTSKWYAAMAASVALVVSVVLFQATEQPMNPVVANVANEYRSVVGEISPIDLPDGSVLVLNTDSQIRINFNEDERLIELLQGELHIEVSHDNTRPLSVIAGNNIVQAVGTAFNVEYLGQEVEIIITDGKVRVNTVSNKTGAFLPADSPSLIEGQMIMLKGDYDAENELDIQQIDPNSLTNTLSWQQGKITFNGEKLSDVLAEVSRYTDYSFELANPALGEIKLAGVFNTDDVAGLLSVLQNSFNIGHYRTSPTNIVLTDQI